MLGFFRTNQIGTNLLLVFYIIVLRLSGFIFPESWTPSSPGILSHYIYGIVGTEGWLPNLISLILVLLQAVMLNLLASKFRLSKETTMFPGVFYILIMSMQPAFLHLSPVILGNTFLILALMNLFDAYKSSSSAGKIFNSGFWIGLASLFYFSNIVFVLLAIIALSILRAFRVNEILMVICGAIVPLFLQGTVNFLSDSLPQFYQLQFYDNFEMLSFDWKNNWQNYATLIYFGLLSLIAFFSFSIYFQKQSIRSQKYIQVLYYFMVVMVSSIFLQKGIQPDHLLLLAIPLALLIMLNFVNFTNRSVANTLHIIWLILTLAIQYKILWLDKV